MTQDKKYKFWVKTQDINGVTHHVEWVNLTERTAKMMYNATANNGRSPDLKGYGWGEHRYDPRT